MTLTDDELNVLLSAGESDRVERKSSLAEKDKICEAICAFERRRLANLPFDARPLPSTSIADLDVDRFRGELLPQLGAADVLAANQRSVEHQLAALHFLTPDDHATPTGMLFVGRDPLAHLPGAYVQFLRIDGARSPRRPLALPVLPTTATPRSPGSWRGWATFSDLEWDWRSPPICCGATAIRPSKPTRRPRPC